MGDAVMSDPTWCVHVTGADDILPAESRRAAIEQAHVMNAAFMRCIDDFDEAGLFPSMWAVPSSYEAMGIKP
jgi:hypothetical protein